MRCYDLIQKAFKRRFENAVSEACWKSDPYIYVKVLKFVPTLGHPLRGKGVGVILQTNQRDPKYLSSMIDQGLCEIVPSPYLATIQRIERLFSTIPDDMKLLEEEAAKLSAAIDQHVGARKCGNLELWTESEKKITAVLANIKERLSQELNADTNEMPVVKKTIFQGVLCRVRESLS